MLNQEKRYTDDLKDPLLSALLKNALADDPAMLKSTGRSERIMRKVLASGVRPARRGFRWAPFAWSTGALAAAAAMLMLAFGMAPHGNQTDRVGNGNQAPITAKNVSPKQPTEDAVLPDTDTKPMKTPVVHEQSAPRWHDNTTRQNDRVKLPAPKPVIPSVIANASEAPVKVAAALSEAGKAASAAGDYQGAYESYQKSYELDPSPDTLLASGVALERLANQALSDENGSS